MRANIAILFLCLPVSAQSVVLENSNAWSGIFTGDEVPYQVTLSGEPNSHAAIRWELATKGRTLSTGQQSIHFAGSATAVASLSLRVPSLKPEVVLPAMLTIDVSDNDRSASGTRYEFKIDIYGQGLLLAQRSALQPLDIRLYDPVGNTAKLFKALTVPFTSQAKDGLLDEKQTGLIVLGSAIALDRERGMIDRLMELAGNGRKILLLQPSSGAIPMAWRFTGPGRQASAMSFADDSVIQSFGYQWINNDPKRLYGISLSGYRDEATAEITEYKGSGWSWLHIAYGRTGGQFTVCMLPVVEHASDSPIVQIILARLLAFAGGRHSGLITEQKETQR